MEHKLKQKLGNSLVESRKESLEKMHKTSIRPHGKLWGMDVFSWYLPTADLLVNTLHTFPFPVVWLGGNEEINETLKLDDTITSHLNTLLFHDSSKMKLSAENWLNSKSVASVSNLKDALRLLSSFKQKNTVLLFTDSSENWESKKETFENFLSLHQTF
jgi:hypothetical protein